ncbi:MAG: hypothetical protein KAT68_00720 [Bacteroidales bacterium]|nr:hypothetical protein [Bacteroidales bacterium]
MNNIPDIPGGALTIMAILLNINEWVFVHLNFNFVMTFIISLLSVVYLVCRIYLVFINIKKGKIELRKNIKNSD